jgi:hypothetical protein
MKNEVSSNVNKATLMFMNRKGTWQGICLHLFNVK